MKRIYIAGPYSADNIMGVFSNMRKGIDLSIEVLMAGYAPFCPWLDYQFAIRAELPLGSFYDYSMAWLQVSDAVLVQPEGADKSEGTARELARAECLGIPIFYSLEQLKGYVW